MIREVKCSLKFSNKSKKQKLDKLFQDYKIDLQYYIDLILTNQLPLKKMLSSKDLPNNIITHSRWKQIIYKHASEIIRSNLKYISKKTYKKYQKIYAKCKENNRFIKFTNKKYSELNINLLKRVKINLNKITLNVDERMLNYSTDSTFDEFIGLKLPYFIEGKKRAEQINLPIKYHKHYNKYLEWKRNKTIKLKKIKDEYYLYFSFEMEDFKQVTNQNNLAIDIGYKKLIVSSNEKYYGKDIERLCNKISRKERDSKKYKKALTERTNYINQIVNQFTKENKFDTLFIENLQNVKKNSKLSRKFNNKLQYWSYKQVIDKLERLSEIKGFSVIKVNPAYTSQTCYKCGTINKSNRKGEKYICSCGYENDADFNASLNILQRGIYSSCYQENQECNRSKHFL